ncbi:MAG: peptidoglycan-binding protein [Synergistaceae bacterium]|jgi:hypothetical protein|nr:peptidoglycan-binding protein [Synergistaceae bacterium]
MGASKKYLILAAIAIILAVAAFWLHEIRTMREYIEHPELILRTGEAQPQRAPPCGGFARPAAERSGPMGAPELAWMLRERIALDVMEAIAEGGAELEVYNGRVRDYNELAASIEYREGELRTAVRLVEEAKGEIVRDAESEMLAIAMPPETKKDERASTVWRVQKYLKMLGYYPNAPDGREGEGTVSAVKTFQVRSNSPPTGVIDEELAQALRALWMSRVTPAQVGFETR